MKTRLLALTAAALWAALPAAAQTTTLSAKLC